MLCQRFEKGICLGFIKRERRSAMQRDIPQPRFEKHRFGGKTKRRRLSPELIDVERRADRGIDALRVTDLEKRTE